MKAAPALLTLALALAAAPASAGTTGKADTLPRGMYVCEMPGDAATARGVEVIEQSFMITNNSGYRSGGETGIYFRTGNAVAMTTGPLKGNRYILKSDRFLRRLGSDGAPDGLRCVKQG